MLLSTMSKGSSRFSHHSLDNPLRLFLTEAQGPEGQWATFGEQRFGVAQRRGLFFEKQASVNRVIPLQRLFASRFPVARVVPFVLKLLDPLAEERIVVVVVESDAGAEDRVPWSRRRSSLPSCRGRR